MKIQTIIARVADESKNPDAYAFLPEIHETLQAMSRALDASKDQREKLARGLERYVLEDVAFSASELGGALLELSEEFVTSQR